MTMTQHPELDSQRPPRRWVRALLGLIMAAIAVMWVYAFIFAPRSGVNPVHDKAWAAGAKAACQQASAELKPLVFHTEINSSNQHQDLPQFVASLDRGASILTTMLDRIQALPRASDRSRALVPQWLGEYRTFVANLRDWTNQLRGGKIAPFAVNLTDTGVPINERLDTFATENRIDICATANLTA